MASDGDLIIIDGCTFFFSDRKGDADAEGPSGFFYQDVRHLSQWQVLVDGSELEVLSSRRVDAFSGRVVALPKDHGTTPVLKLRRDRFVADGAHEDVVLENLSTDARTVRVDVAYASDFADVMEAEEGGADKGRSWAEVRPRSVTLWNERDEYRRGTVLAFSRRGRVTKRRATFRVELGPRERWSLCIDVTPVVDGRRRPPLLKCDSFHRHAPGLPKTVDDWLREAPALSTGHSPLHEIYRRSLLDLAALRIRPDDLHLRWPMPGGGMPWFMTVFGRDSILASYEALPFRPELARATLEALSELQAAEWDSWRDAEPGKILHELRRGTLAATGAIPHTPYYGSHDSTILWLILLDEYERWTGDGSFVRRMEPHARAALGWLEGPADLDGDGYVEYRKRSDSKRALDNQCWKDSDESIVFADGRKAKPPIAVCEHQGYAYDARLRYARLLREVWDDEAEAARLEADAAELKERFNEDFWSRSRGHYVLALDGEKSQVDSMASNVGHLLWSGIVHDDRAERTVRRLLREDMLSGWGIRSLSALDAGYNPLEYHNGTVWPHDTAIVAEGMRRYGFTAEAALVCTSLIDAAEAFAHQLPEVFAGFARDDSDTPVEYPGALRPQAWASGAPLLVLRTLLGLDVESGRLRSRPCESQKIGTLRLEGLTVRGERISIP